MTEVASHSEHVPIARGRSQPLAVTIRLLRFVADGLFVALLLGFPLLVGRRGPRASGRGVAPILTYFACLGIGFMMVEVVLMQRFILFLGHPTHALTAVLFVLLCAGGVGSLRCGRVDSSAVQAVALVCTRRFRAPTTAQPAS